jgi:hypothetical protein
LHDPAAASGMARLRVQPHIIESILNHRSGIVKGVAAVYNRHAYTDEKREARELWGAHVTRCAGNIIVARPVETTRGGSQRNEAESEQRWPRTSDMKAAYFSSAKEIRHKNELVVKTQVSSAAARLHSLI